VRRKRSSKQISGAKACGANPALLLGMIRSYTELEGLTASIIRCAIEVHRELGPGLLESVYRECLIAELNANGLSIACDRKVPIVYKGLKIHTALEVDLMIGGQVIVELKAVESLHAVHEAQLITYLKLTGCPAGLLINFNEILLKNGLRRLDRPDLYHEKRRLSGKSD
jgi:GxxExxY protein